MYENFVADKSRVQKFFSQQKEARDANRGPSTCSFEIKTTSIIIVSGSTLGEEL